MIATNNASSLSASGIDAGLFTLARSTLTPFCNIGVITIKMISSTSITSTIGVTLILALTFAPSSRLEIAIGLTSRSDLHSLALEVSAYQTVFASGAEETPAPDKQLKAAYCLGAAHSTSLQEVINQFARGVV